MVIYKEFSYNNVGEKMKILFFDENKLIIYLNNYYCIDLDLKSKDNLEKYFRALFLKINKNYDILLS